MTTIAKSGGILGLDPANVCGWCWTDGTRRLYGSWYLQPRGEVHAGHRLRELFLRIAEIHRERGVDVLAYEEAKQGSHFFKVQAAHAELEGVIKLVSLEIGARLAPVNPASLKVFATGSGNATKAQMIRAAWRFFGVQTEDDNVADALFVADFARHDRPALAALAKAPKPRKKPKPEPQGKLFR